MKSVKIGIVGTSWWADTMYLPPLSNYAGAEVVACCGRNRERAEALAKQWDIPHVFTDYNALFASGLVEAVIVATGNETHYAITMAALTHDLHVLCEKPLALTYAESAEMTALAQAKGVINTVPFTYRHMPTTRTVKELIDTGYIGKPYHLHLRYYAGFGRDPEYRWRFDKGKAGSGALGDIGSHFLHLAEWFYGEIEAVCANLGTMIDRSPLDPDGQPYEFGDDTAMLMLRFKNGAHGMVHATTLAYEDTPFGQQHEMDFHGSGGTLRHVIDWDQQQTITGGRVGERTDKKIVVPDHIWGDLPRDDGVIATYKAVFREQGRMVREFVDAVATGAQMQPDFAAGARVQKMIDCALLSAENGCWVSL